MSLEGQSQLWPDGQVPEKAFVTFAGSRLEADKEVVTAVRTDELVAIAFPQSVQVLTAAVRAPSLAARVIV